MIRKYLTLFLVGFCGWALTGQAAQAATSGNSTAVTNPPGVTDTMLMRFLSSSQQDDWNAAQQSIQDANDKIKEGNAWLAKTQDPNSIVDLGIPELHKKGAQMVSDGKAMIKTAQATLLKLRKIAIDNYNNNKSQAMATSAANYTVPAGQWPDVIHGLTEKLLNRVAALNYKRVYLGGVYVFDEPHYTLNAALTDQIHQQIYSLDKDHKVFASSPDGDFKIGQENGKMIVDYSDRAQNAQASTKAAVIIGEMIFESSNGYAAFSLRAVDLYNLHVIADQVVMLSVEPSLGKLLEMPAYRVPAKREVPAAGSTAPTAVEVNLQDPNDLIGSSSAYVFRLTNAGHADVLENRFTALILKSYFANLTKVNVSDQDFLALALPADKKGDEETLPVDINAAWQLPNTSSLDAPKLELILQRVPGKPTDVVKLTLERHLDKLTLPSAEELKAGGYTAASGK